MGGQHSGGDGAQCWSDGGPVGAFLVPPPPLGVCEAPRRRHGRDAKGQRQHL